VSERVLVVCGARSLADTPAAKAWAHDKLIAAFAWYEPTLLVHGGCYGSPDEWAHEITECPELIYFADGRLDGEGAPASWLVAGDSASPLLRNRRMMQGARLRQDTGAEVLVVGLTAPWARTHGTESALARARDYGLRIVVRACPAELGPGARDAQR